MDHESEIRPRRGRPRTKPKPPDGQAEAGYQPTPDELSEDVSIDATPDELAAAVMLRHPRKVVH